MGLLSDPEYGSAKWVRVLKKIHGPLCFFCYVAALVWFVLLAHKEFNNETYFSENALLPGLVTNEFNAENSAKQFFNELETELEEKDLESMPVSWLVGKMSQMRLEVYTHNFTLNYPLGQGQVYKGTNVYGILRAPRTSSLEALVVSAPFRALNSHEKGTTAGIALMLAFAQFARPQKYWAKDIIFLVTEHEQLGMQAWLEAYHGIPSETNSFYSSLSSFWKPGTTGHKIEKVLSESFGWSTARHKWLDPGKLKGRSGSIQAAINLEIHDPQIKYIEVKVEGLNGQLPNLDLVNLVHKLCVKSGIHHSYKYSYSWVRIRNKMDEWLNSLHTMFGMVTAQIAGVPNGNHGLFHRYGIEAVTLEGRDASDPAGQPPRVNSLAKNNFHRLGVTLESILRSLNNLLERFHQSYFFYLLAATNRFISIGQYMPSLCLLCVAMLIRALSLWVTIQRLNEDDDKQTDEQTKKERKDSDTDVPGDQRIEEVVDKTHEGLRKRKKTGDEVPGGHKSKESMESSPKKEKAKKKAEKEQASLSIVNIGANYFLVHIIGYAVMNSPLACTTIGRRFFDQETEYLLFYGLILQTALLIGLSPFLPRFFRKGRISREEMSLVNVLALIEMATACLTVGMHNFPLGLALATFYTPLALVVGVVVRGERRFLSLFFKRVFCILLHPLCIVTILMVLYSRVVVPEEAILSNARRGWDAAMHGVMFQVVDSMIYGNWLFNVVTSVILPTWIIFWQILCTTVEP